MERGAATGRVPVGAIRDSFRVRQDGQLIRVKCRIGAREGEPATHRGPGGQLLVRVYIDGGVRRFAAGRIAWLLHCGEWPKGVVKCRGAEDDFREQNLILVRAGPRPFDRSKGGEASSLDRRTGATTALIRALADNPGATVPMLSELVGSSAPCVCTRLGKLSDAGICVGPRCDARARWDLTPRGRELAAASVSPPDDLDKRILVALARAPARQLQLARAVAVCALTARRRVDALIARGLVVPDVGPSPSRRYAIAERGRDVLSDVLGDVLPRPWLDPAKIMASTSRDVRERLESRRRRELPERPAERIDKWSRVTAVAGA